MVLRSKELVCIDHKENHHSYYILQLIEKPEGYLVLQKHGRIGRRYQSLEGFAGLPLPQKSPYHSTLEAAKIIFDKAIRSKMNNKKKTYRELDEDEKLHEDDNIYSLVLSHGSLDFVPLDQLWKK